LKKTKKINCWEFMKCGRQSGGEHAKDGGVCPASREARLDGIHGGNNAGRACWIIAGTMCGGEVQGSFAKKVRNCNVCDFYKQVEKDEGKEYLQATVLLKRLKHG
jgi:hypothetical protein